MKHWTTTEAQELANKMAGTKPILEIAKEYGVSKQRLYQVLQQFGHKTRQRTCTPGKIYKNPNDYAMYNTWRSIRRRCHKDNIPFDITLKDLIPVPEKCPVLGIPLRFGAERGMRTDNSPTVDRLIPSKGYVKGNVCVMSWRANRIKCDANLQEIEALYFWAKETLDK